MDGIETTKLIRKVDSDYARNVPVIALTANAVAGSEQMFLCEGFQAFVSKPISVMKLDAVIHEWIVTNGGTHSTLPESPETAPAEVTDEHMSGAESLCGDTPPGINLKLGLSLYEDDMDMLVEIMRSFCRNIPGELARMRELSEENLSGYAIDIHTLKGAASSIGAKELSIRAKKMERMAKSGDFAAVSELNAQFIEDAETLIRELSAWLENSAF
jgi:HPt (histidine-containing phosphotransfer) domain-containing protein